MIREYCDHRHIQGYRSVRPDYDWDRETSWVSQLPVDKVTWALAGRVTEPGRYMMRFGWLTVTADDLAIWQAYPNAAFTLVRSLAPRMDVEGEVVSEEYRLGSFELRENMPLGEE